MSPNSPTTEAKGITVWFAREIGAGSDWPTRLQDQLTSAAAVLVVMTLHADRSRWVKREVLLAQDLKKPIFPLRLSDYRMFILLDTQDEDVRTGAMPSVHFVSRLAALLNAEA